MKGYLNAHRETLYRNPRYNALYPRFRRVNLNQLPPSPTPPSPRPGPSTVVLSYVTSSPARSEESWHGINYPPQQQPPVVVQQPPIDAQPPGPVPLPQGRSVYEFSPPPPSIAPPVAPSVMEGPPFEAPAFEPRKPFHSSNYTYSIPLPTFIMAYMYIIYYLPYLLILVTLCSPFYLFLCL